MSTIKPPAGPPELGGAGSVDGTGDASSVDGAGFKEAMGEVKRAEAQGTADASAVQATGLEQVVADLKAGRIDATQAVDRLVERAVANSGLPEGALRTELESFLRTQLAEDPTLQGLAKEFG